jgi:hypothetical protein
VYYLFRGLRGVSGEPVIGRLSALNEEAVHKVLEAHAIIPEAVHPEGAGDLFPPSLQAALDEIGVRIRFDQMVKVHEGGGVWTLDREQLPSRVMRLTREVCGGAADRKPALRHIEQLLETLYGERRPSTAAAGPAEGHFANADEVRAEMNRLKGAIKSLERELIAMRSRPYVGREAQPSGRKKSPGDRTRDEVLREIFEHNLQLMKLTRAHGITGLTDQ